LLADQEAEGGKPSAGKAANHPWVDAASAIAKPSAIINTFTCPVSWLEAVSIGTHLRTKGTRCFACGFRRRIPLTAKGLLMVLVQKSIRRPFAANIIKTITRRRRRNRPSGSAGMQNAHIREGKARWLSCGACRTGEMEIVKMIWKCGGVCVLRFSCRNPPAMSPCNRGKGYMTRTRRFCRCAGAWPRCTTGRRAIRAA